MSETVTPYNNTQAKKKQVQTMFDNIAHRYDLLNHLLSFGVDVYWRNYAIKQLKKYKPQYILDVACGTGDFSFAATKIHPKKITGIDISEEMLSAGRKKIKSRSLTDQIEFLYGDSEHMQFRNNTFDACIVAFGVRNFDILIAGI